MPGKFIDRAATSTPEVLDWGELRWLSQPAVDRRRAATVIDVTLAPGKGHDFHKHPDQEEVLLIVAGEVEQWVDREKRMLGPGDSAFVPKGVVHASFNAGEGEARIAAILGPCVGEVGYELGRVGAEAPWNTLR